MTSARKQMIDLVAHHIGRANGFDDGETRPGYRAEARRAINVLALAGWLRSARERKTVLAAESTPKEPHG